MNESDYPHLLPWVRAFAQEDSKERTRRIQTGHWIGYPRAEAALAHLEGLLNFPRRSRMPNLILVGVTHNGKSMILEKFCRAHSAERLTPEDPPMRMPVLKVQMPQGPDEKHFFWALLKELGLPCRINDRLIISRQETAVRLMQAAKVQMLIIDEIHNLLAGRRDQQRRFLNLIRWLGNELQIPLIAAGTVEALRAVQSDDQLANRFTPFALPLWQLDAEYLKLLNTLESILPLRRGSGLSQPALAQRIFTASEGILGEMMTLVSAVAVRAITSGEEMITVPLLESADYIPPSGRRRVAEALVSG